MVRRHTRQFIVTHPAIQYSNATADVDVVQTHRDRPKSERCSRPFADSREYVREMLPQAAMNDGDWTVVEIPHQDHRMTEFLTEQDGVADHLFPLECSLPDGEAQVAVEDVEDGAGFDL